MANEPLSSVLGWVSLACWVVVYSPQIWENYALQSGQGLSVLFVVTWLIGDAFSLAGGLIARLVPTVIILATYYICCDVLLLIQIYYYRWKNPHADEVIAQPIEPLEDTPLLGNPTEPKRTSRWSMENEVLRYSLCLAFVFAAGVAAWIVDTKTRGPRPPSKPDIIIEWKSQILGWASATLFLGARIPQILKNVETKCEGLSPALFLFAISGNTTFALSLCFASMETEYLLANAAWLAGSVLTVFLDVFVLGQFVYYRSGKQRRIEL